MLRRTPCIVNDDDDDYSLPPPIPQHHVKTQISPPITHVSPSLSQVSPPVAQVSAPLTHVSPPLTNVLPPLNTPNEVASPVHKSPSLLQHPSSLSLQSSSQNQSNAGLHVSSPYPFHEASTSRGVSKTTLLVTASKDAESAIDEKASTSQCVSLKESPIQSPPLSPTDSVFPLPSHPPGYLLYSPNSSVPPNQGTVMKSTREPKSRSIRKRTIVNRYCEEMNELNEAANNRPRSELIHSFQQENKHIRELQQENKELRLALEEHQNVMELIMSKYRQQVAKLVTLNANSKHPPHVQDQAVQLALHIERVSEMVAVMRKASQLDEDESIQNRKIISSLITENKGLREMLQIAMVSGVAVDRLTTDAVTQTEEVDETTEPTPSKEDQIDS